MALFLTGSQLAGMETFENRVWFNLTPCSFTTPLLKCGLSREEKGGTPMGVLGRMAFLFDFKVTGSTGQCLVQLLLLRAHHPTPALSSLHCGVTEAQPNAAGSDFLCSASDPGMTFQRSAVFVCNTSVQSILKIH